MNLGAPASLPALPEIHGSSFVRPPIQAIPLDRTFATNDTFVWHGREFASIDTRGSSPGGMTYLLRSSRGDEALEKAGKLERLQKQEKEFGADAQFEEGCAASNKQHAHDSVPATALKEWEAGARLMGRRTGSSGGASRRRMANPCGFLSKAPNGPSPVSICCSPLT